MKHGEVLQNKTFYNDNYRSAKALLSYKGDGKQRIYEPKFTFFGFRYVLVEGLDKVDPKNFEGVVIYTDLEKTIKCETDNTKINRLISNAFWGKEVTL
jgi:alpha-L-rhamnosidase